MKTMDNVYIAWVQSLSSENTKKKYRASVEIFFDEIFDLTPKGLTKENFEQLSYSLVISRFVQPLKEKGVKESTIKAHLAAVRSFMNAVEREEIFPDVNFDKIIKLSLTIKGLKAKDTKATESISESELKEVFYKGDDQGEVFEGLTSSVLRRLMKEFSNETGKNLTPHSIKAGAATTLYARTHDMMMVRDFCDYTSISVTERYIHMTKDPNKQGTAMLVKKQYST